jgi:hypothetical protein
MTQEVFDKTKAFVWETIGEVTTAEAASPAVDERDYTNMVANHTNSVFITFDPLRWNSMGLRFVVDDDGDDTVFDIFATKGQSDYFTRIVTLTLKGGTQVGPATSTDASTVFCDTITKTNEFWPKTITVTDGAGNDRIASVWFDMIGFDTWAFIPTTVDDTTVIQATGF